MDWDVFISYRSTDRAFAADVFACLQKEGFRVWFDVDRLNAGEQFDPAINGAIDSATLTLCLISANYQGSEYCKKEFQQAGARRVPFRIEVDLELVSEIARERLTVPESRSPEEITARVRKEWNIRMREARNDNSYLTCDRRAAWTVLKQPKATTGPRLILVRGNEFQAHDKLLERVRIFHDLPICQVCDLKWPGEYGPAPQDYEEVLSRALGRAVSDSSQLDVQRRLGSLLAQRAEHAQLVLFHQRTKSHADVPVDTHRLVQYFRWFSKLAGVSTLPIVCIQPLEWFGYYNILDVWRIALSRFLTRRLVNVLHRELTGWAVEALEPLPTISRRDLREFARDNGFDIEHFVRSTHTGRSQTTLDAIQRYWSDNSRHKQS